MRIAYYIELAEHFKEMMGVLKKAAEKTTYWRNCGHEVGLFILTKGIEAAQLPDALQRVNPTVVNLGRQAFKGQYHIQNLFHVPMRGHSRMMAAIQAFQPDVFYFRNTFLSPPIKSGIDRYAAIFESNSDIESELDILARQSIGGRLYRRLYHQQKQALWKNLAGVVAVSHELERMVKKEFPHLPTVVIPNGIDAGQPRVQPSSEAHDRALPKLVFIGSPGTVWHGVDLILELAKQTVGTLEFDIVGFSPADFPAEQRPNVRLHGVLDRSAYEQLLADADVGVGTLAAHRKNMYEASPLKVREYLRYGLPIIVAYEDTAFMGAGKMDFILQLPAKEESLKISSLEIADFCYAWKGRKVDSKQIERFIDQKVLENKRLSFFGSLLQTV